LTSGHGGANLAAMPAPAPVRADPPAAGVGRLLGLVERLGNKLPDPALLFVLLLLAVWVLSALLAPVEFAATDPRSGEALRVVNQLSGPALAAFLSNMVPVFTGFHPLGVVLVALLGVGVAERSGLIHAALRGMLSLTSRRLLTPLVLLVGILSHVAADAGYVLVIPLGGVIFQAAGRHPLAGIAAAFAGVSGGFSASFIPTSLDPLLQGLTQSAARLIDPDIEVNPLCNWFFTAGSCAVIIAVGWWVTDKVVEPRLRGTPVDGDGGAEAGPGALGGVEKRGLLAAALATFAGVLLLVAAAWPAGSPLRSAAGGLTDAEAPLMKSIVPLIFLFFLLPGLVFGKVAGTFRSHRDAIKGMADTMGTMGYYIVLAFFAAQFIAAFGQSNLGALLAIKGAAFLQGLGLPGQVTIVGIILLAAALNLVIGSASAKWALLAPVFVPMLMQLGLSPELTQAAYRIGDSSTNIVTPLMPYFPLVVVFCQRHVKGTGIGTLVSLMLPYSLAFLVVWIAFLLGSWGLGLPLGLQAGYLYP
jgi:aminobenzoyl-glutamate transport protein